MLVRGCHVIVYSTARLENVVSSSVIFYEIMREKGVHSAGIAVPRSL